jgi:ferredoxin
MSSFKIKLKNRGGEILDVFNDETILEASEALGHILPYGCRYGGCVTCAARLIKGKVHQPDASGLKDYMREAGYILTCCAYPRSNCTIEVGVESHGAGLYRNPFRDG